MECQYSGKYSPLAIEELGMNLPRATMLLISYNQEAYIEQALQGAIEQDYINLEIVISDDASTDLTFSKIQTFFANYNGPHKIVVNRNEKNSGVTGNLNKAISLSSGEMFFIAAGDDISLSNRVSLVMDFWVKNNKKFELITSNVIDMSVDGVDCSEIYVSDLALFQSLDDWILSPPKLIGAGQAWTRQLFDYFGGLPNGAVGEDLIMAFRAVAISRAASMSCNPLVRYRRGGLTSQRKSTSANQLIHRMQQKNSNGLIEMTTLLNDAIFIGTASEKVISFLRHKLDREKYVKNMFNSEKKMGLFLSSHEVDFSFRFRIFIYAYCPWILAPVFLIKKFKYRSIL